MSPYDILWFPALAENLVAMDDIMTGRSQK